MIIVRVFPFASQFECVWSQMPVNGQKKQQYREFLMRSGALDRTPHTETAGVILQRTKVQHMTGQTFVIYQALPNTVCISIIALVK